VFKKLYFTLPCRGIGPLPGGLINYCPSVLDTVGWVIWPVKIIPDMTYNVFGGTLNPTLPLPKYSQSFVYVISKRNTWGLPVCAHVWHECRSTEVQSESWLSRRVPLGEIPDEVWAEVAGAWDQGMSWDWFLFTVYSVWLI